MEVHTKPAETVGSEEEVHFDNKRCNRYDRVTIMMSIQHPKGGRLRLFESWRAEEQSHAIKKFMEICNEADKEMR